MTAADEQARARAAYEAAARQREAAAAQQARDNARIDGANTAGGQQ